MRRSLALLLLVALTAVSCSTSGRDSDQPTISVIGPFRDASADAFAASMEPFTERTGIRIDYVGTSDLSNDIESSLLTGSAPDVAIIPQPGLIAELAQWEDGALPLPDEVVQVVDANYGPDAKAIGEVDGTLYGVVYKISPKSLIWYPPNYWDANDIEIPGTLDELEGLVDDLSGDLSPWCFTMFSFASTGWIVTDWIEDLLLRQAGPDAYDAWVAGELLFDSPEVRRAMETFSALVLDDDRAFGGAARYLRNQVSDAQSPMFAEPANCVLHRQAGFAENWLPGSVTPGPTSDTYIFVMPPVDAADESRVLVGGDTAVMLTDTPEVREFMSYLATPESGQAWAEVGGYTGAHDSVTDLGAYYPGEFERRLASIVLTADVLRFDGSDLMPASFAGSTLLETLTAWVSGEISLDTAVTILDEDRKESAGS